MVKKAATPTAVFAVFLATAAAAQERKDLQLSATSRTL
jgi:hypothetical protein